MYSRHARAILRDAIGASMVDIAHIAEIIRFQVAGYMTEGNAATTAIYIINAEHVEYIGRSATGHKSRPLQPGLAQRFEQHNREYMHQVRNTTTKGHMRTRYKILARYSSWRRICMFVTAFVSTTDAQTEESVRILLGKPTANALLKTPGVAESIGKPKPHRTDWKKATRQSFHGNKT